MMMTDLHFSPMFEYVVLVILRAKSESALFNAFQSYLEEQDQFPTEQLDALEYLIATDLPYRNYYRGSLSFSKPPIQLSKTSNMFTSIIRPIKLPNVTRTWSLLLFH